MQVEINGVTKKYNNTPVLKEVNLSAGSGDRIAVLGSNGAGKTTLLEIVAGLLKADAGAITYNGHLSKSYGHKLRCDIGFVPQELALFPKLTLGEQLAFWAKISTAPVANSRIVEFTKLVGLGDHLHKRMEHLSGGMKRKLNVVLSLLHAPQLIIADEPTVGIDVQSKLEIIQFIKGVCTQGKTLFFSSHNIREIQQLCNKVAYLHQGQLLFCGTLEAAIALAKRRESALTEGWKAFTFLFSNFD